MYAYENLSLEDMEGELWKQFAEGKVKSFFVSDYGRIKSVVKSNGKAMIKTQKLDHNERPYINITDKKALHVSRLVAQAFIPNPNNLPVVCHNDNEPKNNTVANLRWDTQLGNMRQAWEEGRMSKNLQLVVVMTRKAQMIGQFDSIVEAKEFINSNDTTGFKNSKSFGNYVVMKKDFYNELNYDELLYVCQNVFCP